MNHRFHIVDLPAVRDSRGALTFAQSPEQIPFVPARIFVLFGVAPDAERGHHAHRAQHQYLMMMHGSATIEIDDGQTKASVTLSLPSQALYVPPMLWLRLYGFSDNAVCSVLASGAYDEADYIRDYAEFLQLTQKDRPQ